MDLMICVGGGGQHLALAVARLVRLGVWNNVPLVLVIDAEETSRLALRLKHFAEPEENLGSNAIRAIHPLPDPSTMFHPPLATGTAEKTFRASFLGAPEGAVSSGGLAEEELFDLFYSEKADTVDISVGMAAQPSVGSTVFAEMGIKPLSPVLEGAMQKAERIIVCGSFIGGTGAGVTHQLVKFLKDSPKRGGKSLYGGFLLPWLTLPEGTGTSAANDVTLVNSAKHGIQAYLRETSRWLAKSVIVGTPDRMTRTPASPANDETASFYPLACVYGLMKMMEDTTSAHQGKAGENILTVTSPSDNFGWLLSEKWSTGKGAVANIAERWAASRIVNDYISAFADSDTGTYWREVEGDGLKKVGLIREEENWGTQFRFWAQRKGVNVKVIAANVLAHLQARQRQLLMVDSYLATIFGPSAEQYLARAGHPDLNNKYAGRGVPSKVKDVAFKTLGASFTEAQKSLVSALRTETETNPEQKLAALIENSLVDQVLKGGLVK